jgi:hypothetical protein
MAAPTSSTPKRAAVFMMTSSIVIRWVWTGVAAGASYMSWSCCGVGSKVALPPPLNALLFAKTGFLLSMSLLRRPHDGGGQSPQS